MPLTGYIKIDDIKGESLHETGREDGLDNDNDSFDFGGGTPGTARETVSLNFGKVEPPYEPEEEARADRTHTKWLDIESLGFDDTDGGLEADAEPQDAFMWFASRPADEGARTDDKDLTDGGLEADAEPQDAFMWFIPSGPADEQNHTKWLDIESLGFDDTDGGLEADAEPQDAFMYFTPLAADGETYPASEGIDVVDGLLY